MVMTHTHTHTHRSVGGQLDGCRALSGSLPACHASELFYCMILVFLFEWRIKFSLSYSVQKIEWEQTDGETDATNCFIFPANAVGKIRPG